MTPTTTKLVLMAAAAMMAMPAMAQPVDPAAQAAYEQQLNDYHAKQQSYEDSRATYQGRTDAYHVQQNAYANQQAAYADQRAQYDHEKAAYDLQYGAGSWDRRGYTYDRYPGRDAYAYYRASPCERRASSDAAAGGAIGALAGAAIGSAVAGRGNHTEGAVLGGFAGAAIGASSASSSAARCDARGYYFSYNQTVPYRESAEYGDRVSGQYGYDNYRRMRCRLAAAPAYVDGYTDYRYVRVCPDSSGRYRITG